MSALGYYLSQGYTPTWKIATLHGAGTVTVWTPRTSTKIVVTNITTAINLAGSVAFYFGNLAGDKIVQFQTAGSSTISTDAGFMADSGVSDRTLVANSIAPGTDGVKITVTGFEIPM